MKDKIYNTGVYLLKNNINGKIYVGSASGKHGFAGRWKNGGGYSKRDNSAVGNAIRKYGWNNFSKIILVFCPAQHCLRYEDLYLNYFQPWTSTNKGYNVLKCAGSPRGHRMSEEIKSKQRQRMMGNSYRKGIYHTDDVKIKMSEQKCGNKSKIKFRKRVEGINSITGEVIEFDCIRDVRLQGFRPSDVSHILSGKRQVYIHKGYYWRYL